MPSARKLAALAAGTVVAALLVYLSLAKVDLPQVLAELKQVSLGWLVVAVAARLGGLMATSLRSRLLFAPLRSFQIFTLFKSQLLAFLVQNVVPLRAGELARVGYLARIGPLPKSSCLAVVAAERLLDLLALLTLLIAVLPAVAIGLPTDVTLYVGGLAVAVAMLATIVVSRHPRWFVAVCAALGRLLGRTVGSFVEVKSASFAHGLSALASPVAVIAAFLLSALFWVASVLSVQCWILAMSLDLEWTAPIVVIAFLSLGLAVPVTPGNIGTYHLLAFSAMTTLGVSSTQAGSFAILGHGMSIVPMTLISVILLLGDFIRARGVENA